VEKVTLSQDDNLSFKISQQLLPLDNQRIDLYFSLPNEMGINPSTLNEEQYFYSSISSHCSYYSAQLHLPLVRSRFISQQKGEQNDYRLNLNLFSYQIKIAIDTDIKQLITLKLAEEIYPQAVEVAEQAIALLKKLRRYTPPDQKFSPFFENADNYLSWHVEQSFLKLLAKTPQSGDFTKERQFLLELCRNENAYRIEKKYNSATTLSDPNRITNKMRLLQRLIEYGVVFKKKTRNLNTQLKRLVRGSVTAVIMAFVMMLVLNARSTFTEVTIALVALLGVIYGLREIFKEDLTRLIWRKIQQGLPKWQNLFTHTVNQSRIATQTIWLEYLKEKHLPQAVHDLFQKRRQQNKQAAQLLHFRSDTRVIVKEFLPGYNEIQQQMVFNLTPFVRYLKKGEGRLYSLENNKITSQAVERRYQINLVLVQSCKKSKQLQRFKITLNRSGIVNIEAMRLIEQHD
jgi:ABC-type multidrug transport system fused ATPase/permease subunit